MDAYRLGRDCCVCGKGMMILEPRYEEDGLFAHLACAEYVTNAAWNEESKTLTVAQFRARMREETQDIPKRRA